MKTFDSPKLAWLASLSFAALVLPGCGEHDETCSGEDCSQGGGPTTSTTGGGGEGGEGGAGGAALPATLRVLDGKDAPHADIDVLLHDESGALVAHEKTNGAGEITAALPEGGSVSVLYVDEYIQSAVAKSRSVVLTVRVDGPAPQPLVVRYDEMPTEIEAAGTTTLAISFPPLPAATHYTFRSTCKSDPMYLMTSDVVYDDVPICTADGKYDLLVVAYDLSNAVVDYATLTGQAFVEGGTSEPSIAWAGARLDTATIGVMNLPSGTLSASLGSTASQSAGTIGVWTSVMNPGDQALVELQHVPGYGTSHCQHVSATYSSEPSGAFSSGQASRCTPTFEPEAFVWDASRLARFALDPVDATLPARLVWHEDVPGELGDMVYAEASWGSETELGTWKVFAAPAAREVAFPELPTELASFAPQPGDSLEVAIIHRDYSTLDGFGGFLASGKGSGDLEQQFSVAALAGPVE